MRSIKISLALFILFIFTACNSSSPSSETTQEIQQEERVILPNKQELALKKIEAYAENNQNPKPTLQDYLDAGAKGVTAENLNEINIAIDALNKDEIHTVEEINTIISAINNSHSPKEIALNKIFAYVENHNNPKPTLQDYLDAGATGVTSENLDAMNSTLDGLSKEDIDTLSKINAIIKTVNYNINHIVPDMIIENGENRVEGWKINKSDFNQSSFTNIYDEEVSSKVIKFESEGEYDSYRFDFPEQQANLSLIKWDMKWVTTLYEVQLIINTSKGIRTFGYLAKDTGNRERKNKMTYALGGNIDNEKWHTITRDLEQDLHRYEPNNHFLSIESFIVYGNGYIDNIELYKKSTPLPDIKTPIVVASPGIVLTFDDSLIDDWYAMKDTFKEKGVHATFFCNNWHNLSQEEIAKFRELQNDGHEIAVHTKDHLSTYDGKYNNRENKALAYLEDQVLPSIEAMNRDNFEPNSFSYPYMSDQPKHSDLIKEYLPHIRTFFSVVKQIDNKSESTSKFENIQKILKNLKDNKNIGVFLAHRILPESNPDTYQFRITTEKLIKVIDEVNRLGLKFYTLEEAHKVYLQE